MSSEALTGRVVSPMAVKTEQSDPSGSGGRWGPRDIRTILVTSAWFGGVVTIAAWVYFDWSWALGFASGALVGAANLVFLTALVREVVTPRKRKPARIASLLATKMVVVYGGLAALLLWKRLPTVSVVVGFSLVLIVITLKTAGRALLTSGVLGDRYGRENGAGD
jgi:hypothetical protein